MRKHNRSEGCKQLQRLRIFYHQERKWQSFTSILCYFTPEARNRTLTGTSFLPCAV